MQRFLIWIVKKIIRPKWVAYTSADATDREPELAIKIFGVIITQYNGEELYCRHVASIRPPNKYEFTMQPIDLWMKTN